MSDCKWRHFEGAVILWAVRWYCNYGISYRNLEEMLDERGVDVDHTTIYRWVQRYAPEMEKRLRWYWKRPGISRSWRLDETYVKVKGKWAYLYQAVDKGGDTIDFHLSATRNAKAAKRFLSKALIGLKEWQTPLKINTDKAPTYGPVVAELKREGKLPEVMLHRQVKYLNNVIEADHGKLKQLIKPVRGFKSMKIAYATIKGFEVMHALRRAKPPYSNTAVVSLEKCVCSRGSSTSTLHKTAYKKPGSANVNLCNRAVFSASSLINLTGSLASTCRSANPSRMTDGDGHATHRAAGFPPRIPRCPFPLSRSSHSTTSFDSLFYHQAAIGFAAPSFPKMLMVDGATSRLPSLAAEVALLSLPFLLAVVWLRIRVRIY